MPPLLSRIWGYVAAAELDALPPGAALRRLIDALAADRAYNREICA